METQMDRRISINTLSLLPSTFDAHVDAVARLGASAISPGLEEVVDYGPVRARRRLSDAGLEVATLTHRAFGFATEALAEAARARLDSTLNVAGEIGACSITLTTGGRQHLSWPEAAARFVDAIAPCASRAAEAGVRLAIEPTSHLYTDVSIAQRLSDTVRLAQGAGISLGIDLFACWFDADIDQAIAEAAPLCALVQVSDYVAGDRSLPCRAVPGDGIVPLDRLIPAITSAGFSGWFDLEIIGPRIAAEGPPAALARAARHLEDLLGH